VQVSRVDLDSRKIDFRLVRDTPVKPPGRTSAPAVEHSALNGANAGAGPRVRPFLSDEGSSVNSRRRDRGGKKAAAQAAGKAAAAALPPTIAKDVAVAKKRGVVTKPAAKSHPPRKKR
jgi:ribonuclease R